MTTQNQIEKEATAARSPLVDITAIEDTHESRCLEKMNQHIPLKEARDYLNAIHCAAFREITSIRLDVDKLADLELPAEIELDDEIVDIIITPEEAIESLINIAEFAIENLDKLPAEQLKEHASWRSTWPVLLGRRFDKKYSFLGSNGYQLEQLGNRLQEIDLSKNRSHEIGTKQKTQRRSSAALFAQSVYSELSAIRRESRIGLNERLNLEHYYYKVLSEPHERSTFIDKIKETRNVDEKEAIQLIEEVKQLNSPGPETVKDWADAGSRLLRILTVTVPDEFTYDDLMSHTPLFLHMPLEWLKAAENRISQARSNTQKTAFLGQIRERLLPQFQSLFDSQD